MYSFISPEYGNMCRVLYADAIARGEVSCDLTWQEDPVNTHFSIQDQLFGPIYL